MKIRMTGIICAILLFAGCSTDKPSTFPPFDHDNSITLSSGQSVILARGQTAKVPFGTVVLQPGAGGGTVILNGQKNTVYAAGGVVVSVPIGATGAADNLVVAK